MFRRLAIPLAALALVAVYFSYDTDQPPPEADPQSVRQIQSGSIIGYAENNDIQLWKGIPYAKAPIGNLRWRAPQPVDPWQGQKPTLAFSERCPQLPIEPMEDSGDKSYLGHEDCLYLNVAAPYFSANAIPQGDNRLPVMVWIHGGGNVWGATSQYEAFKNLAKRENVVVVSMNYRLGILGWFSHPALAETAATAEDRSGNFGTLDMIQSLEWVKENITAFGGNPDNVTIFGESAGGRNVFSLLASPRASGLFHRAIVQSGMPISYSVAEAENYLDDEQPGQANSSRELINNLLIASQTANDRSAAKNAQQAMSSTALRDYLYSQSTEQLFAEIQSGTTGEYFIPTIIRDGTVFSDKPFIELFADVNDYNAVPIMLGTNRDEMKSLMMGDGDYIEYRLGILPSVIDADSWNRDTGYVSAMWKVLGADEPASVLVEGGNPDIFVYQFDWDEMTSNWLIDWVTVLGAAHSLEIAFVMTDFEASMSYMPFPIIDDTNYETASVLATSMSSYWGQFAHTGQPQSGQSQSLPHWQAWGNKRGQQQSLVFDSSIDGGIRMDEVNLSRQSIRQQITADQDILGGEQAVCKLYAKLFNENPYFSKRLAEQSYQPLTTQGCHWEKS